MFHKRIQSCFSSNCNYKPKDNLKIVLQLDEEYSNAIKSILVDRNKVFTEWKYKKLEDIPNDLVEKYFRPLNEDLKIPEYDPKANKNSLYPVKVWLITT